MNKKWGSLFFIILIFLMPFFPVVTSLLSLRNSVILEVPVNWAEGIGQTFKIPQNSFADYEFRLESTESKWEPMVRAKWKLLGQNGEILTSSPAEGEEWALTRPMLLFQRKGDQIPASLEIEFLTSNPTSHAVVLKVSRDRALLLEKNERLFVVLLALSLGLLLVVWRPFLWATPTGQFGDK